MLINENKKIDLYEKISEHARKEIIGVRTVYIWLAGALSIIIASGLGVAAFLYWNNLNEMKSSIKSEADIVQRQVNSRIDEEFKKEKIQSIIENKAREYAEKSAQQYIVSEVNEVMSPFKIEFQKTIQDSNEQFEKLNNLYNIYLISNRAKNGSKKAYLFLKEQVNKADEKEKIIINDIIFDIYRYLSQYRSVIHQSEISRFDIYHTENGKKTRCIQDDPIDSLIHEIYTTNDQSRLVLMEYISKKPKQEIFKKAIEVFESDSLPSCAIFCGILSEISEEKAAFLDFDGWTKICEKKINDPNNKTILTQSSQPKSEIKSPNSVPETNL